MTTGERIAGQFLTLREAERALLAARIDEALVLADDRNRVVAGLLGRLGDAVGTLALTERCTPSSSHRQMVEGAGNEARLRVIDTRSPESRVRLARGDIDPAAFEVSYDAIRAAPARCRGAPRRSPPSDTS